MIQAVTRRCAAALFLFLLLPATPVTAQTPDHDHSGNWCGTSEDNDLRSDALHRRIKAEQMIRRNKGVAVDATPVSLRDGVFFLPSDEFVTPGDKPADIEGISLRFRRSSATDYTVARENLQYNETIGTLLGEFDPSAGTYTLPVTLNGFMFPFFGGQYGTVHVTRDNGIYFAPPTDLELQYQHGTVAMLEEASVPMLSALMMPYGISKFTVHVHQEPGLVRLTSRSTQSTQGLGMDVQVTLFSNGDVLYAFRRVVAITGTVIFSPGHEWFRNNLPRTLLMTVTDSPGRDVNTVVPEVYREAVDAKEMRIYRLGDTELVDIEIDLGAPINRAALESKYFDIDLSVNYSPGTSGNSWDGVYYYYSVRVRATTHEYSPDGAALKNARLAKVDTATIRMTTALSRLPDPGNRVPTIIAWVFYDNRVHDIVGTTRPFPSAAGLRNVETDFTALSGTVPVTFAGESFTMPVLNEREIWDRIRQQYGLDQTEIDQVAIYQTFYTDIITYAGAYSTGGWAGDQGAHFPRNTAHRGGPALLHMNKLGYGWNSTANGIADVFNHEFGHRWLFFTALKENGVDASSLRSGGHPKKSVNLPAAFPVRSPTEASTMGGSYWVANADGTFTVPAGTRASGFSWLELYFMGLARPEEVPPSSFYIKGNSSLEGPYSPAVGTYTGTRQDFSFSQIVQSMGPRTPAYDRSQKRFRTLFVVVHRPYESWTDADVTTFKTNYVQHALAEFRKSTGDRGLLVTGMPEPIVASFNAPATANTGQAVSFVDTSNDIPMTWLWEFGDGTTSFEMNPQHTFTSPGTYTVRLTVTNQRGSSIAERQIAVETAPLLFHAVAPCRVLDTRESGGPFTANSFRAIPIAGKCGIPAGAQAVSANFTVTNVPGDGYLSVYTELGGLPRPVSTLNFDANRWALANAGIVSLRADGGLSAFAANSSLDLIIDVNGYFADESVAGGLYFSTVTPCRAYDSRDGSGILGDGIPRAVSVGGRCGVPESAAAVSGNATVTSMPDSGYLRVYPNEGQPAQDSSTLNFSADQWALANAFISPLRGGGALTAMSNVAPADVIMDVNGYFSASPGLRFHAVAPCRAFDTRETSGMGAGTFRAFTIGGTCGVPADARAVAGNVTITGAGAGQGYLSLYTNDGLPEQAISTINYSSSQWALANAAIVPLRPGGLFNAYAANVPVQVIFDVTGYFK